MHEDCWKTSRVPTPRANQLHPSSSTAPLKYIELKARLAENLNRTLWLDPNALLFPVGSLEERVTRSIGFLRWQHAQDAEQVEIVDSDTRELKEQFETVAFGPLYVVRVDVLATHGQLHRVAKEDNIRAIFPVVYALRIQEFRMLREAYARHHAQSPALGRDLRPEELPSGADPILKVPPPPYLSVPPAGGSWGHRQIHQFPSR